MEILVRRDYFNEKVTIGTLVIVEHDLLLQTLEDTDRGLQQGDSALEIKGKKVFSETCIPYGRYEVAVTFSNHFKKNMPLIMNVPGFEGVRIHSGNKPEDTEGCLLVGYKRDSISRMILESRAAYAELFMLIQEKIKTEKIFITFAKQNSLT